ncbi:MAG: phosphotyrosine protein phosphatase [Alphaproteobacteria bacterium]|nr:phosphotyrosine protein phosphatase [Alphaproteobacteria bacterium]
MPRRPSAVKHVLFVCSKNRLRSPTAEQVFSGFPGIECTSAGLSPEAHNPVTAELVEWAHIIFVMEKAHRAKLSERFRKHLRHARVVCLDIPDNYDFMDPALVRILNEKVRPRL